MAALVGSLGVERIGPNGLHWSNIDANAFTLRTANYMKSKKKGPSDVALYSLVDTRMFRVDTTLDSAWEELQPCLNASELHSTPPSPVPHVPEVLLVCWNFPTSKPSMMNPPQRGPGVLCAYLFTLSDETRKALVTPEDQPNSVKLWETYCKDVLGPNGKENTSVKSRFKAITSVANMKDVKVPSLFKGYNGKPVLIKKSGTVTRHGNVLEMNVNVHQWGYQARKGFDMLMGTFPTMILDTAFVIEGRAAGELPEQVLGCARISFPKMDELESWPPAPAPQEPPTQPSPPPEPAISHSTSTSADSSAPSTNTSASPASTVRAQEDATDATHPAPTVTTETAQDQAGARDANGDNAGGRDTEEEKETGENGAAEDATAAPSESETTGESDATATAKPRSNSKVIDV